MKGRLSSHMEEHKPIKSIVDDLKRTLKSRNFLVHDFFRVHSANWFSEKGRKEMLTILENAQKQFVASDEKLESFCELLKKKYNIPDYSIEDGLKELVKNNPNGPFALTLCFCATCL